MCDVTVSLCGGFDTAGRERLPSRGANGRGDILHTFCLVGMECVWGAANGEAVHHHRPRLSAGGAAVRGDVQPGALPPPARPWRGGGHKQSPAHGHRHPPPRTSRNDGARPTTNIPRIAR
jgi:hypothetical protein